MTKKRFDLVCNNHLEWMIRATLSLPIRDNNINKEITLEQCHVLLNELYDENHNFQESRREIIAANNRYREELDKLKEENRNLKEKSQKKIQFVFKAIETYSDDCFHHNEGGWSYMLNDLIEYLKDGMDIIDGDNND